MSSFRVAVVLCCLASANAQAPPTLQEQIEAHQYDLATKGRAFLLEEASRTSYFLLGELHGENEIPALIATLWPAMWGQGYRHVAAEVSPWAAAGLESGRFKSGGGHGLWRQGEADSVTTFARHVIWGCDIEEVVPQELVRELALKSPANETLKAMAARTYERKSAAEWLGLARRVRVASGSTALLASLRETLEVEALRADQATRFQASTRRELVMKQLFLENVRAAGGGGKVMARFGRNHLHRGYDRRGVSTLGNFIAEFALARAESSFHVAAFAAGGKIRMGGATMDADETGEDPALALLASGARFGTTVFDLRPLRWVLHRIPEDKRSAAEAGLVYWADSYDAIVCYREVTPLQ